MAGTLHRSVKDSLGIIINDYMKNGKTFTVVYYAYFFCLFKRYTCEKHARLVHKKSNFPSDLTDSQINLRNGNIVRTAL